MTQQRFQELKFLIQENAQGITRNYEMIGRIYEEHGGRLDRLEERFEAGRLWRLYRPAERFLGLTNLTIISRCRASDRSAWPDPRRASA